MPEVITEEWRPIPGYERLYEVSDAGMVRSLNYGRMGGVRIMSHKGGRRYSGVKLSRGGHIYRCLIHVQVAAAFIGPKPEGMQVNHKNGNGYDNRLENLEYVTASENSLHAYRIGLRKPTKGEINGMCKLNSGDIRAIRDLILQGFTHQQVAQRFNLARQTVGDIATKRSWRHLN